MRINKRDVELKSVAARGASPAGWVDARLTLLSDVSMEELGELPFGKAAQALVREGQEADDNDGPNSVVLRFKRPMEAIEATVSRASDQTVVRGKIASAPEVRVIEGKPALRLVVDTDIPVEAFAILGDMVGAKELTLSIKGDQLDLFAEISDQDRVVEVLRARKGTASVGNISEATGISDASIRVYLQRLTESGVVRREGRGQYAITGAVAAAD